MLLAVEFPDAAGDTVAGKRTLVVRLGPARAAALYIGSLVLAYVLMPAWTWVGLPAQTALALCALLPIAAWLGWRVLRGEYREPRHWNRFSFATAALVTLSGLVELGVYVELASRQH
jgi:1,4-dihydroxy-2-naphthoate octaprenyltransferase